MLVGIRHDLGVTVSEDLYADSGFPHVQHNCSVTPQSWRTACNIRDGFSDSRRLTPPLCLIVSSLSVLFYTPSANDVLEAADFDDYFSVLDDVANINEKSLFGSTSFLHQPSISQLFSPSTMWYYAHRRSPTSFSRHTRRQE